MSTYRKLKIWQKSMNMVTQIYQATNQFPKKEIYGLSAQIRRASVSIPSNIAEGHGRTSKKEYARFLTIAMGSLFEIQTQLEISKNLNFINEESFLTISKETKVLEQMLSSYIRKIKASATDLQRQQR